MHINIVPDLSRAPLRITQGAMPRPPVAAPDPPDGAPLLPPLAEPELNTRRPLTPAAPAFALLIDIAPLLDAVPSPLSRLNAPPLCTVLRPESALKAPPDPLVPLPTLLHTTLHNAIPMRLRDTGNVNCQLAHVVNTAYIVRERWRSPATAERC